MKSNKEIPVDEITTSNITNLNTKDIKEIARELTFNYLINSFGDNIKTDGLSYSKILADTDYKDDLLKRFWNREKKVRNIMVIGAGATYDTYKGIHTGDYMVREMKRDYEDKIKHAYTADGKGEIKFVKDRFNDEKAEIIEMAGKEELSLENYLYLLSKWVPQQELRKKIKAMTGIRYAPSFFNEIVAHLLKHSFLDVVVNFNFEESLDQAIEEEIGKENYHAIISDGHCVPVKDITVNGRLKMPVYIKPHGSNSHKSTLRFTNKHYFDLPADIKIMMEEIFEGKLKNTDVRISRVNLFVVGFALNSHEFNKIIGNMPEDSVIYHIDKDPFGEKSSGNKGKWHENLEKMFAGRKVPQCKALSLAKILNNSNKNKLTTPLGELMSVIWRKTYYSFSEHYRPRSIARHEITSYLLYEPSFSTLPELKSSNNEERKSMIMDEQINKRKEVYDKFEINEEDYTGNCREYFLDRVLVEIMLAINRNDGVVDIVELLKERTGRYYQLYLKNKQSQADQPGFSLYDIVSEFCTGRINAATEGSINIFYLQDFFTKEHFTDVAKLKERWAAFRDEIEDNLKMIASDKLPQLLDKLDQLLIEDFKNLTNENSPPDKTKPTHIQVSRTFTLLGRLFSSKRLSRRFKENLLNNFHLLVHNGISSDVWLINELYRLVKKTVGSNYYVINPRPQDPVHYMFESFEEDNLKHTNLAVIYEFNSLFNRPEWDIAFFIAETGGMLGFLKELNTAATNPKKTIFLICSYESAKQLHLDEKSTDADNREKNKEYLDDLRDQHLEKLLPGDLKEKYDFRLLFVPSNEHNHHIFTFFKQPGENKTLEFEFCQSLYMYRRGFSNSMDPLLVEDNTVSGKKDQIKLLALFFNQFLRAKAFESSFLTEKEVRAAGDTEYLNYKKWKISEFYGQLQKFLGTLYMERNQKIGKNEKL